MAEKKIDLTNLESGLEALTGNDYANAERQARMGGDSMPVIQFSGNFQAALAAKALNVTTAEIKALPIAEYATVLARVSNFLLSGSLQVIVEK